MGKSGMGDAERVAFAQIRDPASFQILPNQSDGGITRSEFR